MLVFPALNVRLRTILKRITNPVSEKLGHKLRSYDVRDFESPNGCTTLLLKWKNPRRLHKRYINDVVRVRFAPSPTGFLHLGGLRTALYNHLFAKSKNGITILRIEDTDLSRKVASATENIIKDLSWCGIKFDEGPYFQSERKQLYQEHVKQLLDQGDAYYCFCSNVRLELCRKEAIKAGEVPKYDNHCRSLSKEDAESKLKNGESCCIRFKLSAITEPFHDLICGPVLHNVIENEGDPVIVKNDGWPTYHFANVIDDHLMNITHVLRGVEWQVSTSKHILLYRAFNWNPPHYGHLPLLMNPDGTKISKREGNAQVRFLREAGYFPNALLNFIIRFGGGFEIEQKEKDERSFTFDELVEKFDVTKIKSGFCKAQLEYLDSYNALEIKRLLGTEDGKKSLVKMTRKIVEKHFENRKWKNQLQLDDSRIELVFKLLSDRIFFLDNLVKNEFEFLWVWCDNWCSTDKTTNEVLQEVFAQLETVEWNAGDIKKALKSLDSYNLTMKLPDILKTLRFVLTGIKGHGPNIAAIMVLLGKKEVLFRLSRALEIGLRNTIRQEENQHQY